MDSGRTYERHYDGSAFLLASPDSVFDYIDDHARFSSHMNKSSWMMGGGSMETSTDSGRGRVVGSHISMSGKVLGISLYLDEVIINREPPHTKAWETVGRPRLIVVDHYRMKIEIEPQGSGSMLRVSIDYNLPVKNRWLGKLFGAYYAKWCVQKMIKDARSYFAAGYKPAK